MARRTPRDARRRTFGQNFLTSPRAIRTVIDSVRPQPDELIFEIGAGRGALTIPLARHGARVIAVEKDPVWVERLHEAIAESGVDDRVRVRHQDFRAVTLPKEAYRVVAAPPFSLTTALLARLLDDPVTGPWRADLLLQYEVARKRASPNPTHLRTAAWAPWWTFELGPRIHRTAFRPIPSVDTAMLSVFRRPEPVLPEWLAPSMREVLRSVWHPPAGSARHDNSR